MSVTLSKRNLQEAPCKRRTAERVRSVIAITVALAFSPASLRAAEGDAATPPPGPGQTALFETPHLHNISQPETLEYRFDRTGPAPLVDHVDISVDEIHPDGTKYVSFDFLTGTNHTFYPAVDHFSGNPLLMVFLEHDMTELKEQTGIAAAHFRDDVRAGFDGAKVSDTTVEFDGKKLPAREIVMLPFGQDERLTKLHSFQVAEFRFVVADDVPGGIASMSVSMPADAASGAVPWSEKVTFTGVKK